jgi:DNA-directed RNA polymerase subunit RPC12/RpoP
MAETKKHYLVVECAICKRFLLAMSTNETRTCPYCGKRIRMRDARVVGHSDTAEGARVTLQELKAEGNEGDQLDRHLNCKRG